MSLEYGYASPRWSQEMPDCSMPMTFDTYSVCSFNCLYCFSFFQRSYSSQDYKEKKVKAVKPQRIKDLFTHSLNGDKDKLTSTQQQFYDYIRNGYAMQWGGLSDGFDKFEEEYGVSLEILKFFDTIDYPLSISTKGVFFTKDDRYMDLIKRNSDNWHWKISLITADAVKARSLERGVPTPEERLKAIERLADAGCSVTLRLRPYMVGISEDYKELIRKAKQAGADSVTTEFFCLDTWADDALKEKYKEISKFCGFDLWDYYKEHSSGQGLSRLNYEIKLPIIVEMKEYAHSHNMRFYVSDAHHKEKCDGTCCCGTPQDMKTSEGHFAGALQLAKEREDGKVYWSDIEDEINDLGLDDIRWRRAIGFNTLGTAQRTKRNYQSLADWLREIWNNPKSSKSPYKYFEKILYPVGKDENNNVIYKYNKEKANFKPRN